MAEFKASWDGTGSAKLCNVILQTIMRCLYLGSFVDFRIKLNVYKSVIHLAKTVSALNDSITAVSSSVASDLLFPGNANLLDMWSNLTCVQYIHSGNANILMQALLLSNIC